MLGYSILKGHFQVQTDADTLTLDPDFGYSLLASVDLADFDLLTGASLGLPDGGDAVLDDFGDSWGFLDSYETFDELEAVYGPGEYLMEFSAINDGDLGCVIEFPDTPLPPAARFLNYTDLQAVNPSKDLTISWEYAEAPDPDDVVQVYVSRGHSQVFATSDPGDPDALDITARSVDISANTLEPGGIYSLNIEVTRLAGVNSACHPDADGITAMLRSTSVNLISIPRPMLRLISAPANEIVEVEVAAAPDATVILQGSLDFSQWSNLSTNSAPSGTNVFTVNVGAGRVQFFRAFVE